MIFPDTVALKLLKVAEALQSHRVDAVIGDERDHPTHPLSHHPHDELELELEVSPVV